VGVEALADQTTAWIRDGLQAAEQILRRAFAADEPEVVSEHEQRVEATEAVVDLVEPQEANVANSSPPAGGDGAGGRVDPDHVQTPLLKMKADAPRPAAEVEHPPPDEAHGPSLDRRPAPERLDQVAAVVGEDHSVVALDDLYRLLAVDGVEDQPAVGVLALLQS
jgi:hypothetical protein